MKNRLLKIIAVVLGIGIFATCSNVNVAKANDSTSDSIVVEQFEEKSYTFVEEDASFVFTLKDETTVEIVATHIDGNTITVLGEYTLEENIITIYAFNEELGTFEIGENNVLTRIEVDISYPCNVVLGNHQFGDVMYDIEGGNVGDIVTINVKPYSFYKITSLKANGVELTPNEDGTYQFALIEGDNVITANFEIDNEQFAVLAENLANIKDGNWEDVLNIENLFTIISWAITLFVGSGFFVTLIKSKRIETKTKAETTINTTEEANKAVEKWLNESLMPIFEKIHLENENTEQICKTLVKCFILSQEGTPESRIAIINELTNLNKTKTELTEEVLAIINNEIEEKNRVLKEKENAIKELEEANNSIVVEESETEGRY